MKQKAFIGKKKAVAALLPRPVDRVILPVSSVSQSLNIQLFSLPYYHCLHPPPEPPTQPHHSLNPNFQGQYLSPGSSNSKLDKRMWLLVSLPIGQHILAPDWSSQGSPFTLLSRMSVRKCAYLLALRWCAASILISAGISASNTSITGSAGGTVVAAGEERADWIERLRCLLQGLLVAQFS